MFHYLVALSLFGCAQLVNLCMFCGMLYRINHFIFHFPIALNYYLLIYNAISALKVFIIPAVRFVFGAILPLCSLPAARAAGGVIAGIFHFPIALNYSRQYVFSVILRLRHGQSHCCSGCATIAVRAGSSILIGISIIKRCKFNHYIDTRGIFFSG